MFRKHFNFLIRLLLISFLFQSFMVTGALGAVTYDLAKASHRTVQICTTSGISWIDVSPDQDSSRHSKATSSGHCMFCGAVSVNLDSNPTLFNANELSPVTFHAATDQSVFVKRLPFQLPNSQAPPTL